MTTLGRWCAAVGALMMIAASVGHADSAPARPTSSARTSVRLSIDIEGRRGSLGDATIRRWVRSMVGMASDYCGRFPVRELRVNVRLRSGSRVVFGQHFSGRRVDVHVGRNASLATLEDDHVLLHELLHTALPMLDRRHRWLREGLSTYLETMVRAQHGIRNESQVWARWTRSMPMGLPGPHDRGLDRTRSWARVYWGGALFWLTVDLRLREATQGRQSVRSLVRGVVARGGVATQRWSMRRLLRAARAATGTNVLAQAYRRYALRATPDNLDRVFERLGVTRRGDTVQLTDRAPRARMRRAMMVY